MCTSRRFTESRRAHIQPYVPPSSPAPRLTARLREIPVVPRFRCAKVKIYPALLSPGISPYADGIRAHCGDIRNATGARDAGEAPFLRFQRRRVANKICIRLLIVRGRIMRSPQPWVGAEIRNCSNVARYGAARSLCRCQYFLRKGRFNGALFHGESSARQDSAISRERRNSRCAPRLRRRSPDARLVLKIESRNRIS